MGGFLHLQVSIISLSCLRNRHNNIPPNFQKLMDIMCPPHTLQIFSKCFTLVLSHYQVRYQCNAGVPFMLLPHRYFVQGQYCLNSHQFGWFFNMRTSLRSILPGFRPDMRSTNRWWSHCILVESCMFPVSTTCKNIVKGGLEFPDSRWSTFLRMKQMGTTVYQQEWS